MSADYYEKYTIRVRSVRVSSIAKGPVTLLRILIPYELRIDFFFIRSRTHNTHIICISIVLCKFYVRRHAHRLPSTLDSFGLAQNYAAYAVTPVISYTYAAHRSSAVRVRYVFVLCGTSTLCVRGG